MFRSPLLVLALVASAPAFAQAAGESMPRAKVDRQCRGRIRPRRHQQGRPDEPRRDRDLPAHQLHRAHRRPQQGDVRRARHRQERPDQRRRIRQGRPRRPRPTPAACCASTPTRTARSASPSIRARDARHLHHGSTPTRTASLTAAEVASAATARSATPSIARPLERRSSAAMIASAAVLGAHRASCRSARRAPAAARRGCRCR